MACPLSQCCNELQIKPHFKLAAFTIINYMYLLTTLSLNVSFADALK